MTDIPQTPAETCGSVCPHYDLACDREAGHRGDHRASTGFSVSTWPLRGDLPDIEAIRALLNTPPGRFTDPPRSTVLALCDAVERLKRELDDFLVRCNASWDATQAQRRRAEVAERERDEWKMSAETFAKTHRYVDAAEQRAEAAEAKVQRVRELCDLWSADEHVHGRVTADMLRAALEDQ